MKSEYLELPWSMEDTIENLKELKENLKIHVKATNLHGKGEEDAKEFEYGLNRAIEALEKQIPMAAVYEDNCGNKTASARCPRCFEIISNSFCGYCGQHLK